VEEGFESLEKRRCPGKKFTGVLPPADCDSPEVFGCLASMVLLIVARAEPFRPEIAGGEILDPWFPGKCPSGNRWDRDSKDWL